MKRYVRPTVINDLSDNGRIILAHGEVTGHCHEIITSEQATDTIPPAQYFEEPGTGRRVLMATRPCALRHDEHGLIALDPSKPVQVRQGDVLLNPIGAGAWEVIRQREYSPEAIRNVAD